MKIGKLWNLLLALNRNDIISDIEVKLIIDKYVDKCLEYRRRNRAKNEVRDLAKQSSEEITLF